MQLPPHLFLQSSLETLSFLGSMTFSEKFPFDPMGNLKNDFFFPSFMCESSKRLSGILVTKGSLLCFEIGLLIGVHQ